MLKIMYPKVFQWFEYVISRHFSSFPRFPIHFPYEMASFKLDGKVPYSAVGEFFGQPKEAHRALDRMDFWSSY
jgi:hypothetical protein